MIEFDIVAQFAAIPVDMRRRPILVEVVIAEPDKDGHVNTVAPRPFLITTGELLQLPALARLAHLTAAVVGKVAAKHQAERLADLPSGARKTARLVRDRFRPTHGMHRVEHRHVAQQVGVGLALRRAVRRKPFDRDEAGVDVV